LRELDAHGAVSLRGFYLRRSLRIFPAFYAFFALALLMELRHGKVPVTGEVVSAFAYVSNYYSAVFHPRNAFLSQTWSLGIEEQFYLVWPAVFLWLARRRQKMPALLLGAIGCEWLYRAGLQAAGVNQSYIYHAFDTRLDHLLVGCLLAVVLQMRLWEPLWTAVCANSYLAVLSMAALALSSLADLQSTAYRDTIGFALEPLVIGVLIVQLIAFHRTPLWRWVQWPAVRFVGRISYSLYLYQQLTLTLPDRWLGTEPTVVKVLAAIAVTGVFASGSYFFIERPFMRLKDRLQGQRTPIRVPVRAFAAEAS
jgi:peptidoglycan/LPS O-acetylase OafA/YrhL